MKCRHAERPHSCRLTFGFSLLVKGSEEKKNQDITRIRLCYFEHIIGLRIPHDELQLIYNLLAIIYNSNWMLLSDKVAKILVSFLCRRRIFLCTLGKVGIFLELVRQRGQQVLRQHKCFQPVPKVLSYIGITSPTWKYTSDSTVPTKPNTVSNSYTPSAALPSPAKVYFPHVMD